MGRVFVLGAGFSKAAANLPLMKEVVHRIWESIIEDKRIGDPDERLRADVVGSFLNRARQRYLVQPLHLRGIEVVSDDFFEDFEFLLTLLDLNSTWIHSAQGFEKGKDVASYSIARMDAAPDNLPRHWIEDYIHRVLWRGENIEGKLTRFVSKLRPGDAIVTFNYDLILERALLRAGLWHPSSGYGVSFEPAPPWIGQARASRVLVLKLHGSLNWGLESGSLMLHPMYDEKTEYLPGCIVPPSPFEIQRPPFGGYGMLPSLSKCFDNRPLLEIWASANERLRAADEIIVIGYSLPSA